MAWFKKNILFTIIMVLLAGLLAAEIYYVLGRRQEANEAEAEFQAKVEEHNKLSSKKILPHENNVALLQTEVERKQDELGQYHTLLKGDSELQEAFKNHPKSRADAFFDIASFVQEYRRKAAEAEVGISENETFGFGAYATTGPAEDQLAEVYKQRLIVARILDEVFEAGPQALLSIRRPGEGGSQGQREGGGSFNLESKFSVAIPDMATTLPFEVVFTGHTDTLRSFLNQLSTYETPLMVRKVEVTPAAENPGEQRQQAEGGSPRRRSAPARQETPDATAEGENETREAVPLVRDNLSRFTVALEFVDVRPVEKAR